MISISHAQARRLIQAYLDINKLPEDQWLALQAHLEICTECRMYRDHFVATERSLRRALHQRWDTAEGPMEGTAPELAAFFRQRKSIRRVGFWMVGSAAAFLLFAIGLVAWSSGVFTNVRAASLPGSASVLPTSTPAPTPTRVPANYRGVIAYEYRAGTENASEIFILNAGSEPANLTKDPANDHAPAWSPDGQWLAFLSDRTGKDEVYVMHISGTRLTRLTDLPEVSWRGPLSWSPDGQLLALVGERRIGAVTDPWVYLVPLDGSNAYPLGQSRGAIQAVFSPSSLRQQIAFSTRDERGGRLLIYDFDPQSENFLTVDPMDDSSTHDPQAQPGIIDRIDWSRDGMRLLFRLTDATQPTVAGETLYKTSLRAVNIVDSPASGSLSSHLLIGNFPANSFSNVSWTGIQNEISYLGDDIVDGSNLQNGCRPLYLLNVKTSDTILSQLKGFCVEDGLERANWRVSGKSLLIVGHEADQANQRGLYVLRFQGNRVPADWLVDARGMVGPPQLRPTATVLAIDPRPVNTVTNLPPSPLPGPEAGDLLVITKLNQRTLIDRLAPGSSQRTTINQSIGQNSCPTWAPDHSRIAFISNRDSGDKTYSHLFVMDASGLNARRITETNNIFRTYGALQNECRIWWSQNNRWLAARTNLFTDVIENGLNVYSMDKNDEAPVYLPNDQSWSLDQAALLPDGRLIAGYSGRNSVSVRSFFPATFHQEDIGLWQFTNWSSIISMAVSPDGKTLVMGLSRDSSGNGAAYGLLFVPLDALDRGHPEKVESSFQVAINGSSASLQRDSLYWLSDGRLAYILRYPAGRQIKAEAFAIRPGNNAQPERLAAFSDSLLAAAWSQDGHWLTAITEAGRYALDLSLAPGVAPAWVDVETSSDLDW